MQNSLFGDDPSNEGKKTVEVIDNYRLIRDLLNGKRLGPPIGSLFGKIKGTRVWDNRFEGSNLPILIECTATDESGNLLYPNMMLLTKEQFKSYRRGKPDELGQKTREVPFGELPIVSKKVLKDLNYVQR